MLLLNNISPAKSDIHEVGKKQIHMTGISYAVVDKYKDMIYRTALTMTRSHADAEDIMQNVFFKYFRLSPAFGSESHEKAWFLRVTINESKNLLKSFWKSRRLDADLSGFAQYPEKNIQKSPVLEAVMHLPAKYRIAVYLYYYENYSVKEIAGMTGRSEAAVAQHLSRGRNKLRKALSNLKKEGLL